MSKHILITSDPYNTVVSAMSECAVKKLISDVTIIPVTEDKTVLIFNDHTDYMYASTKVNVTEDLGKVLPFNEAKLVEGPKPKIVFKKDVKDWNGFVKELMNSDLIDELPGPDVDSVSIVTGAGGGLDKWLKIKDKYKIESVTETTKGNAIATRQNKALLYNDNDSLYASNKPYSAVDNAKKLNGEDDDEDEDGNKDADNESIEKKIMSYQHLGMGMSLVMSESVDNVADLLCKGLIDNHKVDKETALRMVYKCIGANEKLDLVMLDELLSSMGTEPVDDDPSKKDNPVAKKSESIAEQFFINVPVLASKYMTEAFDPNDLINDYKEKLIKFMDKFEFIKDKLDKVKTLEDFDSSSREIKLALSNADDGDAWWKLRDGIYNLCNSK